MRKIHDSTEPGSDGSFNSEAEIIESAVEWDTEYSENNLRSKKENIRLIKIANSKISLIDYLKTNIKVSFDVQPSPSGWTHKSNCPFKDHNDGSPSFFCNSIENRFKCWGCNRGGGLVHFISEFTGCGLMVAAEDILSKYGDMEDAYGDFEDDNNSIIDELMLGFSNEIRDFIRKDINNSGLIKFAERAMYSLDVYIEQKITYGSDIDVNDLEARINLIKDRLDNYE